MLYRGRGRVLLYLLFTVGWLGPICLIYFKKLLNRKLPRLSTRNAQNQKPQQTQVQKKAVQTNKNQQMKNEIHPTEHMLNSCQAQRVQNCGPKDLNQHKCGRWAKNV